MVGTRTRGSLEKEKSVNIGKDLLQKFWLILFSHDTLEGTCQVSPEVSKTGKKKGGCVF